MMFKYRHWEFNEPNKLSKFEYDQYKSASNNNTLNLIPKRDSAKNEFEFEFKLFKLTFYIFIIFIVLDNILEVKSGSFLDMISAIILLPLILLSFATIFKFLPEYSSFQSYQSKRQDYYFKLQKAINESESYEDFCDRFYIKWYQKIFK